MSGVSIVPYDEQWEKEFFLLKQVLNETLEDYIIGIEHVGSTSVKGLAAKPIIDMDIVIERKTYLAEVIDKLSSLGYEHQGDLGIEGREAFKRTDNKVPWSKKQVSWMEHHLYVCDQDNNELHRHIKFRNHLRTHTSVAIEYEQLKMDLANRATSRAEYTELKTHFIEKVLNLSN